MSKETNDEKKAAEELSPEARARFRFVVIGIPGLMGAMVLVYYVVTGMSDRMASSSMVPLAAIGMMGASAVMAMMFYLQTGSFFGRKDSSDSITDLNARQLQRSLAKATEENLILKEQFDRRLEKFSARLDEIASTDAELSGADRDRLLNDIQLRLREEASEALIGDLEAKAKERAEHTIERNFLEEILSETEKTESRLNREVEALARRGNLNLAIGIAVTLVGLGLLGFTVYGEPIDGADLTNVLAHYLPRISLVLFIEVFAYFFLRLYKSSLTEIKYFQNELTGIEARYLALKASLRSPESKVSDEVINKLAEIDRNLYTVDALHKAKGKSSSADQHEKELKAKFELAEKALALLKS